MAPEIFRKSGHGKPVDIWAIGVITYFLLCGYTPFDRDTQYQEMQAIINGDYRFEPAEYWSGVSNQAKEFVKKCLTVDPTNRPTAGELLKDPWLVNVDASYAAGVDALSGEAAPKDLLPQVKKAFDARKTFRKAVLGMMAVKRMQDGGNAYATQGQQEQEQGKKEEEEEGKVKMQQKLDELKKEADQVSFFQSLKFTLFSCFFGFFFFPFPQIGS